MNKRIDVRLPEILKGKVEQEARETNRSVNKMVLWILRYYFLVKDQREGKA